MAITQTELSDALASEVWNDGSFWTAMEVAEERAKEALFALYEELDDGGCGCETCVVRVVLETVWPTLTAHLERVVAINSPVQTLGGCKSGSCRCKQN